MYQFIVQFCFSFYLAKLSPGNLSKNATYFSSSVVMW